MPSIIKTEHTPSPPMDPSNGSLTSNIPHIQHHDHAPQSRDHSPERRGRPAMREAYLLTTMRPPELVKKIQTTTQQDLQPTFIRSRDPSVSTLHSQTSAEMGHVPPQGDKLQRIQSRTSRFKHPMNAYAADNTIETVVPHHSSMLQQKYNAHTTSSTRPLISTMGRSDGQASSRSSLGTTNTATRISERSSRPSVSVPMGGDLVPAFDDMNMDMDEEQLVQEDEHAGEEDCGSSIKDIERVTAHSSLTDALFPHPNEAKTETETKRAVPVYQHQQVGRIQQRIHALKALKDDEESSWNSGFSNVEQKTLLDSLNYDLQSLKRYNYRPLISSLQRVSELEPETLKKIRSARGSSAAEDMNKQYLKSLHPLMNDLKQHKSSYASTSSTRKRGTTLETEKLQQLLRKSSEVSKSLWVDQSKQSKLSATTTASSNGTYNKSFELRALNDSGTEFKGTELDRIHEHFAGFKLGHSVQHMQTLTTNDPSPKTHRIG